MPQLRGEVADPARPCDARRCAVRILELRSQPRESRLMDPLLPFEPRLRIRADSSRRGSSRTGPWPGASGLAPRRGPGAADSAPNASQPGSTPHTRAIAASVVTEGTVSPDSQRDTVAAVTGAPLESSRETSAPSRSCVSFSLRRADASNRAIRIRSPRGCLRGPRYFNVRHAPNLGGLTHNVIFRSWRANWRSSPRS